MPASHYARVDEDDSFIGTGVIDYFYISVADLTSRDYIVGGDGAVSDELRFTTSGTITADMLSHVSGIEKIRFLSAASNTLIVTAQIMSTSREHVTIIGNDGNDWIDGSAGGIDLEFKRYLDIYAGAGNDTLIGGRGRDIFRFDADALNPEDSVNGGSNIDKLVLTSAGSTSLAGVRNVEDIQLHNGGNNLTVNDVNTPPGAYSMIYVHGGKGSDVVDASSMSDPIMMWSGGGGDRLLGGSGDDTFRFDTTTLFSTDVVDGGAGNDYLVLNGSGAANLVNLRNVENVRFDGGGVSIKLTDEIVSSTESARLIIREASYGSYNDVVDAHKLTGVNAIDVVSNGGNDTLIGGAGADNFYFSYNHLNGSDIVRGGRGPVIDALHFTTSADMVASAFAGVSGIEALYFSDDDNVVEIPSWLLERSDFTGREKELHVHGGAGRDTFMFRGGELTSGIFLDDSSPIYDGSGNYIVNAIQITSGGLVDLANVKDFSNVELSAAGNHAIASNVFAGNRDLQGGILGNSGNDVLDASKVTSGIGVRLLGRGGNDIFISGSGADYMQASLQKDTFRYVDRFDFADRIEGFGKADRFEFSAVRYDYNGAKFDTVVYTDSLDDDITGADLIVYAPASTAAPTIEQIRGYFEDAAGGSPNEGAFLLWGRYLYHAVDASFTSSNEVAPIAYFGSPKNITLESFIFF